MAAQFIKLVLMAFLTFAVPAVWTRALTKSHRGVNPGTQLEYAQSPVDFLNSKGYDLARDNTAVNRNNHGSVDFNDPKPTSSSFDGALSYDQYAPQDHGGRNNAGSQPAATLYNNYHAAQPNNQKYNPYKDDVSKNVAVNPNQQSVQQYTPQYSPPSKGINSASRHPPQNSNARENLGFDLFNNKNFGRSTPQIGQTSPYFDRTSSDFGQASPYFGKTAPDFGQGSAYAQPNPFARGAGRNNAQHQQGFPYDMSAKSHDQVRSGFNNYNTGYNNNGYSPILSQGFSLPTTYQGEQKTEILPNEAFSSVTDPRADKRVAISSYIPSNNFVNPTNFLIPAEDKYSMISRIFGGFQTPVNEHQKQQGAQGQQNKPHPSPHSTISPTAGSNNDFNAFADNSAHQNNYKANGQNAYGNNYNNNQNVDYTGKNTDNSLGAKNVVESGQVKNQEQYFSGTKSLAKPGFGQGFENQGSFSYSPTQSLTRGYDKDKSSIFGVSDNPQTVLFSDFSYDNPLSLNQFRSKNLLGDENFGQTDYDKNRLTPDNVFGRNNNNNYYQNADLFTPSSNTRVSDNISGVNGYTQTGGAAVTAGNSFDKSYSGNRGYDTSFDDNDQKTGNVEAYSSPRRHHGYSDQSANTDGYNNAAAYSDGDGYSNSVSYSDGGSDSNYAATDDNNERGYEKSYQNSDDDSDADSYSDSQGYNRVHYDGKNYDVNDGYTDNVNYDTRNHQDSNHDHYTTEGNSGANDYRQGVGKVVSALTSGRASTVQPYRGLIKSVTEDLPEQANYKPFNVNGPVIE